MRSLTPPDVTQLLRAWSEGDSSALSQLIPVVYAELHRRAHHYMNHERPGHTLQTSALIHETYLRLAGSQPLAWQNRAQFLAVAARLMRQVLVDHARARRCAKRGGGAPPRSLDEARIAARQPDRDLVRLDAALEALAANDERKAQVVELRYFGGLSVEETAAALGVSPQTVLRDWRLAKAWLLRELRREAGDAA